MDGSYRLKIKVGPHEFEAEGTPEDVREQFLAFKEMVQAVPITSSAPTQDIAAPPPAEQDGGRRQDTPPPAGDPDLTKIMKVEGRVISLTVPANSVEDSCLLLLYGQRALRQVEMVTGAEIVDGLTRTGGLSFGRSDRIMEKLSRDGDVIMTGENRGKRYRLTNSGLAKARQIANSLISIVA